MKPSAKTGGESMEKKSLEGFFDDIVKTVQDGLTKLADKTDQLTQIGRLKLDIASIKRDIDKQSAVLGSRVYQLAVNEKKDAVLDDLEVKHQFEKLAALEDRLAAKKGELERASETEKGGDSPEKDQPETENASV